MRSNEIGNINEALHVLRHFIDLSARLLPFLYELECRRKLSAVEAFNRDRIRDIYQSHSIDCKTSEHLINSNVLELIMESYEALVSQDRRRKAKHLNRFLSEYERLKFDWEKINAN